MVGSVTALALILSAVVASADPSIVVPAPVVVSASQLLWVQLCSCELRTEMD
jgi:hypothetical protein